MTTSSFRASRAPQLRAASALAFAVLLSCSLALPTSAAPKGGGNPEPQPAITAGRIAVGPETTPGDLISLYVITQPGSYYLTGNVLGVETKLGIRITTAGVTLDLNGFDVIGTGTTHTADVTGISVDDAAGAVRIFNGSVRNWKKHGISSRNSTIDLAHLKLTDNGGCGLYMNTGSAGTISHSQAEANGMDGFLLLNATITNSIAKGNVRDGFVNGSALACTAVQNLRHGFSWTSLDSCTSSHNGEHGVHNGSLVVNSTVKSNGRHGIRAIEGARIVGNTSMNNGPGRDDSAGIWATNDSLITDNRSSGNTVGIMISGTRNRIEDNHVTQNATTGLYCDGVNNIIIRNTARNPGAMNWYVVAGNRGGAFVAPPVNSTVSGATGGSGSGTNDPFANLSF